VTLVVDASVALKWFIDEDGRVEARALLTSGEPLIAPDLIVPELINAAWKAVRRSAITREQAGAIPASLPQPFMELVPTANLAQRALAIALALDHAAYDAFYLALAEQSGMPLVSSDSRLLEKVRRTEYAKLVRPLSPK
jgi:predicted nucleic acid-binding protein